MRNILDAIYWFWVHPKVNLQDWADQQEPIWCGISLLAV